MLPSFAPDTSSCCSGTVTPIGCGCDSCCCFWRWFRDDIGWAAVGIESLTLVVGAVAVPEAQQESEVTVPPWWALGSVHRGARELSMRRSSAVRSPAEGKRGGDPPAAVRKLNGGGKDQRKGKKRLQRRMLRGEHKL